MRRCALLMLLGLAATLLFAGCAGDDTASTRSTTSEGAGSGSAAVPADSAVPGTVVGAVSPTAEEEVEASRRIRVAKVLKDAGELEELLNAFWTRELAALYRIDFDPPDGFWYYEGSSPEPACAGLPPIARNAHYCRVDQEEHVAFDLDWFQEYLVANPGGATTFLILAHEWGHAVQDTWLESGGPDVWIEPNLELNADCLAGVFLAQSIREGAVIEEPGDEEAIFDWLYEAGSDPWLDPDSHGTREERQTAFAAGLEGDTDYCRTAY